MSRRCQAILDESSRYNLGTRRTVNSPTLALTCLHPRNQPRFAWKLVGGDERNGVPCWRVRFGEQRRPTLVRSKSDGDIPIHGLVWIEAESGAVVASRAEMTAYGKGVRRVEDDRVEAHATYSAWRRAAARVEDIILPPPGKP